MAKIKLVKVRKFCYEWLCLGSDGRLYLKYVLSKRQRRFYGQKISPLLCFRKYRLCRHNLKRPHLSCFGCRLRKVVSGELPLVYPITQNLIWIRVGLPKWRYAVIKKLISLAEFFSH